MNPQLWEPRQSNSDGQAWGIVVKGSLAKPDWIILPNKNLDQVDVSLIVLTHNAAIEQRPERSIICSSIVNEAGDPRINITIGPEVAQLGVRDARQHVTQLQETIEASMSDALLLRFIRDHVYQGRDDAEVKRAVGTMLNDVSRIPIRNRSADN